MSGISPELAEKISARNRAAKQAVWGGATEPQPTSPPPAIALRAEHGAGVERSRKSSDIEVLFDQHIRLTRLPEPLRNYIPFGDRNFELDFAWPDFYLAAEIQGMVHRIKENFERDIEKRALLQLRGWTVLEVSGATIRDGRAINWLEQLINQKRRLP